MIEPFTQKVNGLLGSTLWLSRASVSLVVSIFPCIGTAARERLRGRRVRIPAI